MFEQFWPALAITLFVLAVPFLDWLNAKMAPVPVPVRVRSRRPSEPPYLA